MSPVTAQSAGIQVIWQDLALFPEMTVAENIAFQTLLGRWPRFVNYARMRETAGKGTGSPRRYARCRSAAQGISDCPAQIVGDRPGTRRRSEARIYGRADRLAHPVRNGSSAGDRPYPVCLRVAVVFVSHRLAEVLEISSRVTVLKDGALVGVYPTAGMTQSRITELMTARPSIMPSGLATSATILSCSRSMT